MLMYLRLLPGFYLGFMSVSGGEGPRGDSDILPLQKLPHGVLLVIVIDNLTRQDKRAVGFETQGEVIIGPDGSDVRPVGDVTAAVPVKTRGDHGTIGFETHRVEIVAGNCHNVRPLGDVQSSIGVFLAFKAQRSRSDNGAV